MANLGQISASIHGAMTEIFRSAKPVNLRVDCRSGKGDFAFSLLLSDDGLPRACRRIG
jgi:hypothetical protein